MIERTKLRLRDIGLEDFFWATFTPTQGALMLIGVPPGAPKEVPKQVREHFVDKGLLEEKYGKIIDRVLKMRKDIEYGTVKEVDPKEVIDLLKDSEAYLKRLEKLFTKLEKGQVDDEIEDLYKKSLEDVQASLKMIEVKSTEKTALSLFKKHVIETKLAPTRYFTLLSKINKIRKDPKSTTRAEIARLQFEQDKLCHDVFNRLGADKGKKIEKYKVSAVYDKGNKNASIWLFTDEAYIILDTNRPNTPIKKFKISGKGELIKAQSTTLKEIEKKLTKFSGSPTTMTKETIASLKRILADDVKIVIGS